MSNSVQAVRGMHDILPGQTARWQHVEGVVREVMRAYAYEEIRLPLLEKTELYLRTIGEVTDIVEKEMYTFEDRNSESLSLRPEGTAGCVRAGIENGLLHNQTQRLWYAGPMFRHERPQKGRYRQFYQFGVEAFGFEGPDIDAELILLCARIFKRLGFQDLELQINSLGSAAARAAYRERLVEYFSARADGLDEDSRQRLHKNPLRILDSKNPAMQDMIREAPQLLAHLDDESVRHFEGLKTILDDAGIKYRVNPRLVRGLDYYTKTVFEWVTDRLGAQGTVCAGGRFDNLVEQLGGKATPAIGLAVGMERLIGLLEEELLLPPAAGPDFYLVMAGDAAERQGKMLAERLRDACPRLSLMVNCGGGGFKAQFKRADKSGAGLALILGEDEVAKQQVAIKSLRSDLPQQTWTWDRLLNAVAAVKDGKVTDAILNTNSQEV